MIIAEARPAPDTVLGRKPATTLTATAPGSPVATAASLSTAWSRGVLATSRTLISLGDYHLARLIGTAALVLILRERVLAAVRGRMEGN